MTIQLFSIKGNTAELLFNPKEDNIQIGNSILLEEPGSKKGLIVQVVQLSTFNYPSKTEEQIREMMEKSYTPPGGTTKVYEDTGVLEAKELELSITKIRRTVLEDGKWIQWDGWIPIKNVESKLVSDESVFKNTVNDFGNPLHLGQGIAGIPFNIDGLNYEKVNIITSAKGMGKSHLTKVIIIELIRKKKACIVFDVNNEYTLLSNSSEIASQVKLLTPADNFKISVEDFGVESLMTLLRALNLPETSQTAFETYFRRLLNNRRNTESTSFLSITNLIDAADRNEIRRGTDQASQAVNGAIANRLRMIRDFRYFAEKESEGNSIDSNYEKISESGGLIIINVAGIPLFLRKAFVHSIIEKIKGVSDDIRKKKKRNVPFLFFEEAHLYINKMAINDIVTRSRHFGITSTFITNMVTDLDEVVIRQADNLFLLNLPFKDDVRHISKSSLTDQETVEAFAQSLSQGHAMVVGQATSRYPIVFKVDKAEGFELAGETWNSFEKKN